MSTSNWSKALKQLNQKVAKKIKYIKHNKPKDRAHGIAKRVCVRCGNHRGHIGKYGLHLCRHCFRDFATDLGFKKFR